MLRAPVLLALALLLLTGCGAVEASTPSATAATPSLPCFLPYGTRVTLVLPSPGSVGAAAAAPVIVAASRELPKSVALVATDRKGNAAPSAALERTAPPAHARPPFPNPVYYRATAGLHPHRHYTVALDDIAQNGCAPYAAMSGNARFST